MAYIPKGARWYLAEVILEHTIEGDARNVIHVNTMLVEAASPGEAYVKALALGRSSKSDYLNPEGKKVRIRFRGLRDLNVIHDELEHGAELIYEEKVAVPESQIREWVKPKKRLGVFTPIKWKTDIPNYCSAEVMKSLETRLAARDEPQEE